MIVEKTCKQCGNKFSFEYEAKGSGSGNKLRRSYCSIECKREYNKKHGKSLLTETCLNCHKEFKHYPSRHVRYCSIRCRFDHKKIISEEKRKASVSECLICKKKCERVHYKYCSPECFGKSRIRRVTLNCDLCGKEFTRKLSEFDEKRVHVCSRKCQYIAQSCGLIKVHVNGRSGFRTDIPGMYFKSSFEADFARILNYFQIEFEFESKTFTVTLNNGKTRNYTPDFYIPSVDVFIELKSCLPSASKFSKMMNSNFEAALKLNETGSILYIITMKSFYDFIKSKDLHCTIPNIEHTNYNGTKQLIIRNS